MHPARRILIALAAFAVGALLVARFIASQPTGNGVSLLDSYAGQNPAPDFPEDLDWLNTGGRRLSLADLRGKVVLLDFWTYGCINCIHIIPDLKRLEADYAQELVVIGVHSAKFDNEGRTENIRRFAMRYDIEHPIVNDRDFQVWRSFGARAWPTVALIDPVGALVGKLEGEGHYELLDYYVGNLIAEFDAQEKIDRSPLNLVKETEETGALRFPGKVLAAAHLDRLFIADTSHHRIVITDLQGRVLEVIGSGRAELADGGYADAGFFLPQGMTLADDDTLYVADTENHAIRRIDLAEKQVSTAAGTGRQTYLHQDLAPARGTALNSPWDVLFHQGLVYVAMAGQHQVWVYEPASDSLRAFAGSRREELKDGPLLEAGLNQPSGLAVDAGYLYVADSEASAIRRADLDPDGRLETVVGRGLFEFGDVDGKGRRVRLQHPLGVAVYEGLLLVADTYNSKIKRIDPEARRSVTFVGGDGQLDEPGGLSVAGERLYVADTNNHRIRVVELPGGELRDFPLHDPDGLL